MNMQASTPNGSTEIEMPLKLNTNDFNLPVSSTTPIQSTAVATAAIRDALVMEHLTIVKYVARNIHERLPQHVELEDLMSAGMVGLIDAAAKFDLNKKVQFKSYAQFRIRGAILDSLRILDWSPRDLRRRGRAAEKALQSLTCALGRSPSQTEIAVEMGLSLSDYQSLLSDLRALEIGSLNVERSEGSDEEELAYVIGGETQDPLFLCLQAETRSRLAAAIEELPDREKMVISLYYFEELTMREIGQTINVVESRVSQIHSAAVARLRRAVATPQVSSGGSGGRYSRVAA